MFLCVDIGNSTLNCAVFESREIVERWDIETDPSADLHHYLVAFRSAIGLMESPNRPEGGIAASVVSGLEGIVAAVSRELWDFDPVQAKACDGGLEVVAGNPEGVGVDRLLAAGEAYRRNQNAVIVVDAGSAVTVDLVSAEGVFLGGAIWTGLKGMASALSFGTSLLLEVDLEEPESAIGRSTSECIRAGLFWGTGGGVDRLIQRQSDEASVEPKVVLTGGDADRLSPFVSTSHEVVPDLVLHGLAWAYRNRRGKSEGG